MPQHKVAAAPQELKANFNGNTVSLQWKPTKDAAAYAIYRTRGNSPDYELIATDVKQPTYKYTASELKATDYLVFKIASLNETGDEGKAATICVEKQ